MAVVDNREEAWVWTAAISSAIKSEDNTRPLVSGMHSLTPTGNWRIQDQGELTDILTTHPYPFWTPYSDYDPVNTIRPLLHATAETLFYSNIGKKNCFAEETGTMGPMICSDEIAGEFARTSMISLWAHDCHGFLWWCAHDQNHLTHAPYDWMSCERELGLLRENGEAKPVIKEMGKVKKMIDDMPFEKLPSRDVEAVCITNSDQDHWAVAYSSFILSKQAGFDIEFQHEDQQLKDSLLYIIPSIKGVKGIRKHKWTEILNKVSQGASLYISIDDGYVADFEEVTGIKVNTRSTRNGDANVVFKANINGIYEEISLNFSSKVKLDLNISRAQVIGCENNGNPALTTTTYGKGKVFFMTLPIEMNVIHKPGVLFNADLQPYYKIYSIISEEVRKNRVIQKDNPYVGITEHSFDESTKLAIMINYSPKCINTSILLKDGWEVESIVYGENVVSKDENFIMQKSHVCSIAANDVIILFLKRN
ncbi:hypothetical protein [Clostridium lacusfryxellense]|uniref:hypothetical protein n=1 Tax=Clostridium lacusfryxellense TaxID=205328 RepID=UPI001C0CBF50|nr:hypothetical protein [Clostridium lacusfryxellense]MBU3113318.1 hypothetical protein [Clostridium lacusfryxellense]